VPKYKPFLKHIRAYKYKVYIFIKNRLKLDKLAAKAEIGYLIRYDFINIYRIWIPFTSRIIYTRDVLFDEASRYYPNDKLSSLPNEVLELIDIPTIVQQDEDSEVEDIPLDKTILVSQQTAYLVDETDKAGKEKKKA